MAVSLTTTITAPITLSQYAQSLPEDSMSRIFVENMMAESDLMRVVPFLPAQAGKREFMDIASTPTVGFRALNAAGGQDTGDYNMRSEDTFFMDEYVYVDRATIDRLGPRGRTQQERLKSIAMAQYFTAKFLKGDNTSSPSEPNGLQARCGTLNTNLFHNSLASGGAALSLVNLDKLYWSVNKPTHWIFPRSLMPYVDAAVRNSSVTGSTFAYSTDPDYGHRVMHFKGLPILFGYEPDDTPDMLPMTEVASGGGSAVTGSIYCASFRDGGVYAIEQTPLSVEDEGQLKGTPQFSTHMKWDWGIAREHPRSVARLTSITAAALVA